MAAEGGTRAILAAFFANLGIAIAKFIAFAFTGAASMLAEAVHSVADTSNQGLLLLGRKRARRGADEERPFGYGRERYFWSFIVALVLFTFGGLFALFEGIEKLRHPHELGPAAWAIGVLAFAIVAEIFSLRTAVRESRTAKGSAGWWHFIREARSPELPVVLLEDIGALLGLVFALVGVGLAEVTGNARWDALGSVAIGILLTVIALVLTVEMRSLLIGETAHAGEIARIRREIEGSPRIRRLLEMRTQHLGPEQLLVAAKVELDPELGFDDVVAAVDEAERRVRESVPSAVFLYMEPDLPSHTTGGS
ncbi:MAG: cation diffusion facilitator family transporter [Nitriliruptorales bacterium]